MSADNVTFVSVPADAILDATTGLQTTLANNVGSAGRVTVTSQVLFMRGYTSQSV